jgi:hypothetical protein
LRAIYLFGVILAPVNSIFLIGRFPFDYVGDSPITRTDDDDFIIFDEEHVGLCLWRFA